MIVIAIARFTSFISASFFFEFLYVWTEMSRNVTPSSDFIFIFFLWLWRVLSCLFQPMCRLLFGNVTPSSDFIFIFFSLTMEASLLFVSTNVPTLIWECHDKQHLYYTCCPPRAPSLCMEDFISQMKADKELNRKF